MSEETNDRLRDEATGRFYKAVTDAAMRGDSEPHPLENFKPSSSNKPSKRSIT
jgi:hypothetical protein